MDGVIEFFVPGIAKPAGSKRAFVLRRKGGSIVRRAGGVPAVVVTDDSGRPGKDWRGDVKSFASRAYQGPLLHCPVWLRLTFIMQRPKSHYTTKGLRQNAPMLHATKPDATKLLRSVEDGLTGIIWADDSSVQIDGVTKVYGEAPGVHVQVWPAVAPKAETPPLFAEPVKAGKKSKPGVRVEINAVKEAK